MVITTSPSKDRLFQSKRRSLGRDDLLQSSAVNCTTGISPLDATQRARRRRISQGGGWAKGRERSQSRPRPLPGAVTKCLDNARKVGRDYIWPVVAWMFVLVPAILSLLLLLLAVGVVAEPLVNNLHNVACRVSPPAVPGWLSAIAGPFRGQDLCMLPTQTAEKALFNGPTAVEILNDLPWPSTEIQKLKAHQSETNDAIRIGTAGAIIIRRQQHPHPSGLEAANLLDEWSQRHDESHQLMRWLVNSQKFLHESISSEPRHLCSLIDRAKRNIAYVEANPTKAMFVELKSVWIPGYFAQTPMGEVVADFEGMARKHVKDAKSTSKIVSRILQSLGNEKEVLEDLKVTLPLNWKEFIRPGNSYTDKQFKILRDFLQYDFEQWLQGSLTLAVRFQKENDMLAEKLTDTAIALRQVYWNKKERVRVMRSWKHQIDDLRATLDDARAKSEVKFEEGQRTRSAE